eukprot:TRINITY_DN3074_c1_g1_i1.p1 TRINITY_DN3074_c1_g1~~TRINITY_DN3074_c1_g1_i1.p1  ORF type:complete len:583 (+),score=153.72 TRINITY_DN3074_c1_g1_i1:93-1841(+)
MLANMMSGVSIMNGPSGMPPAQRRLRHLKCIIGRNMEHSKTSSSIDASYTTSDISPSSDMLLDIFYTLHSPEDEDSDEGEQDGIKNTTQTADDDSKKGTQPKTSYESSDAQSIDGDNTAPANNDTQPHQDNQPSPTPSSSDILSSTPPSDPMSNSIPLTPLKSNSSSLIPPTLSSSSGEDDPTLLAPAFYTSEMLRGTTNPTWRYLDCSTLLSTSLSDHLASFNICMWDCRTDPISLILQYEINLAELDFVATDLRQMSMWALPKNTLMFELRDGLYTLPDTRRAIRTARQGDPRMMPGYFPATAGEKKIQTCSLYNFVSLISKKKTLQYAQENSAAQQESIEIRLAKHDTYFLLLRQRDALRQRVAQLQDVAAQQKAAIQQRMADIRARRVALLPRARELARAQVTLIAHRQQLTDETKKLDLDRALLSSLHTSLSHRKWQLLAQLRQVYPIQQSPDGKSLSVNGFRLPNSDFTGCDEEQIATALGYVTHILCMAARYLDVPLRYPMVPMCSRSVIRDEISQQPSPKFPLYSRGVDRTRFEYAVFLLNKNLEQLLNSQGLDIITLRHTLPNVQILLSHGQG